MNEWSHVTVTVTAVIESAGAGQGLALAPKNQSKICAVSPMFFEC